jgi:predicted phage-related endonuclease
MIVEYFEQGSPEWKAARVGIFTASQFDSLITPKGKATTGKAPESYINRLVAECLTGERDEIPSTYWMRRGIELEPEARDTLEGIEGMDFEEVGIIYQDDFCEVACSPDGVDFHQEVGCEIKCPSPAVHVEYLRAGVVPDKYIHQVQGSMLVTGFNSWYFMSYHPSIKPLIIKVERDDEYIAVLQQVIETKIEQKLKLVKDLEQI